MKINIARKLKALIIDDEPEYLDWVDEFLKANNFETEFVQNLSDAINAVTDSKKYDIILIDMNIPSTLMEDKLNDPVFMKYPGLYAAITFRNKGYWPTQIIAYTVHDDESLETQLNKYRCRYVLKGRPNILKSVILKSIETHFSKQNTHNTSL